MVKQAVLIISLIVSASALLQTEVHAASRQPAYFEVAFTGRKDKIVIKISDPKRVEEARKILIGKERRSVMGKVVKGKVAYNPKWKYHLSPSSISFFELATEVCDLSPRLVEKNLNRIGGSVLPRNVWCPWSSYLSREVGKKS